MMQKMCPLNPNEAMYRAADKVLFELYHGDGGWIGIEAAREQAQITWRAMYDAAPSPAPASPEPRAEPADDLVAQIKDDIRSGEVGPNILCRQIDKLGEALRQARTDRDVARNALAVTLEQQRFQYEASEQREAELRAAYSELLYGVARKFPGESRHQTALRYIRQAETNASSGVDAARAADKGEA